MFAELLHVFKGLGGKAKTSDIRAFQNEFGDNTPLWTPLPSNIANCTAFWGPDPPPVKTVHMTNLTTFAEPWTHKLQDRT